MTTFSLGTAGIAFICTLIIGPFIIRWLQRRSAGKSISDEGPASHMVKEGTPTMGGLIFLIPIIVLTIVANLVEGDRWSILLPLVGIIVLGTMGYVDDLGTLIGRIQSGLTWKLKFGLLVLFSIAVGLVLYLALDVESLNVPWVGQFSLGPAYIVIAAVTVFATVISVAISDGLDTLCGGTGAIAIASFGVIAVGQEQDFLVRFAFTTVGALLGFLWFNAHPAKVFMGDTGAMALGGDAGDHRADDGSLAVVARDRDRLRAGGIVRHHPGWLVQMDAPPQRRGTPGVPHGAAAQPLRDGRLVRAADRDPFLVDWDGRGNSRYRSGIAGARMTLPRPAEAPASFEGQRVGVVGLGIEGADAVAFLRREGAEVIRVDHDPERADRPQDDLTLLDEVRSLVVSQGVPYDLPLLVEAGRRSVPVFGPVQIFLERCPANRVIGITGSAGKTTTTTLVHRMLKAAGVPTALGGNIGRGLLQQLPEISADTTVVAEISHTQLLRTTRSPQVAAITNITPNHLDQFSWDEYQALKYRIVEFQTPHDRVVLPLDEPLAARAITRTPAIANWFGLATSPCAATAFSDGEQIVRNDSLLMRVDELLIPGEHNLRNALAALAIVGDLVPDDVAADVLRAFTGVPHRLELVAELGGVRFVNDSIATTPERTLAGLRAISGPIVLMLGGRDKKLPLDSAAAGA